MKPPQRRAQARGGTETGVSRNCLRAWVIPCWKAAMPSHVQLHEPINPLLHLIQVAYVCHLKMEEPKLTSSESHAEGCMPRTWFWKDKLRTPRKEAGSVPLNLSLPPNSLQTPQHACLGLTINPYEPYYRPTALPGMQLLGHPSVHLSVCLLQRL